MIHIIHYIIILIIILCMNRIRSKDYFGIEHRAQYWRHVREELFNCFKISIAFMIIWEVIYWLIKFVEYLINTI